MNSVHIFDDPANAESDATLYENALMYSSRTTRVYYGAYDFALLPDMRFAEIHRRRLCGLEFGRACFAWVRCSRQFGGSFLHGLVTVSWMDDHELAMSDLSITPKLIIDSASHRFKTIPYHFAFTPTTFIEDVESLFVPREYDPIMLPAPVRRKKPSNFQLPSSKPARNRHATRKPVRRQPRCHPTWVWRSGKSVPVRALWTPKGAAALRRAERQKPQRPTKSLSTGSRSLSGPPTDWTGLAPGANRFATSRPCTPRRAPQLWPKVRPVGFTCWGFRYPAGVMSTMSSSHLLSALHPQGPCSMHDVATANKLARDIRDAIQRECARKRARVAKLEVPKERRLGDIKSQRDKRSPVQYLHSQGPMDTGLAVAAGVGIAGAAVGLFQAYNFIRPLVSMARHVHDSIGDDASEVASNVKKFAHSVNGKFNRLEEFGGQINSFFSVIKDALYIKLGPFWQAIAAVSGVWLLLHLPNTVLGNMARIAVLGALAHALDVWSYIQDDLPSIDALERRRDEGVVMERFIHEQGGANDVLSKIFSTVMVVTSGMHKDKNRAITDMSRVLSTLPRVTEGWDSLICWSCEAFDWCVNFITGRLKAEGSRLNFLTRLISSSVNPAIVWLDKANSIRDKLLSETEELRRNERAKELLHHVHASHQLCTLLGSNSEASRQIASVRKDIVSEIMGRMPAIKGMATTRQEPTFLCLRGPPGNGKSYMLRFLAAYVYSKSTPDCTNLTDIVWTKGVDTPYWNGYAGQPVIIHDEIFQKRVSGNDDENDYMSLLREVNSCVMPLNFADVQSKGMFNFESKLIIGTTNVECIKSDATLVMHSPEALRRRMHFPFEIDWAGQGDAMQCVPLCTAYQAEHGTFPFHFWRVRRWDFIEGRSDGDWQPLNTILDDIARHMSRNRGYYEEAEASFLKYAKSLTSQGPLAAAAFGVSACAAGYMFEILDHYNISSTHAKGIEILDNSMQQFRTNLDALDDDTAAFLKGSLGLNPHESNDLASAHLGTKISMARTWINNNMRSEICESSERWTRAQAIIRNVSISVVCFSTTLALIKMVMGMFKTTAHELTEQSSSCVRPVNVNNTVHLQSLDPVLNNVLSNVYKLCQDTDTSKGYPDQFGYVTFICGRMAVMPKHFLLNIQERVKAGMVTDNTRFSISQIHHGAKKTVSFDYGVFKTFPFKEFSGTDLCMIQFVSPHHKSAVLLREHKNILSAIITDEQAKSTANRACRLDLCDNTVDGGMVRNSRHYSSFYFNRATRTSSRYRIDINGAWTYPSARTNSGDCGAPLTLEDGSRHNNAVLFGLHVAIDDESTGYAVPLTRCFLKKAMTDPIFHPEKQADVCAQVAQLLHEQGINMVGDIEPDPEFEFDMDGFNVLCAVPPSVSAHLSPKTKLFETQIAKSEPFGVFDKRPARLADFTGADGDRIRPMAEALKKYGSAVHHGHLPGLLSVMAQVFKPFLQHSADAISRVFTYEEAVKGIPELNFKAIPRGTSAGYPYTVRKDVAKKTIFGFDDEFVLDGPFALMLRSRVDTIISEAKKGNRLLHIFTDALKDELRSESKAATGQTRLLSCSPICLTLTTRMYFGAFVAAFMSAPIETGFAPGLAIYKEWDKLHDFLCTKGDKVLDGDFKALDATEVPLVQWAILDFIEHWYKTRSGCIYSAEDAIVRRILFMELTNSRHIGGDGRKQNIIYEWLKSLPSGHPLTTVINTIYCLIVIAYTYYCNLPKGRCMSNFWDDIAPAVFGDDHAANVTDIAAPHMNQVTIAKVASEKFSGMTYTSADKQSELTTEHTVLYDIKFLQRGFLRRSHAEPYGHRLCPLALDHFIYTNYWCSNRRLQKEIERDNWENMLLELSFHDTATWEKFSPDIFERYQRACRGFTNHKSKCRVPILVQQLWREELMTMPNPWG